MVVLCPALLLLLLRGFDICGQCSCIVGFFYCNISFYFFFSFSVLYSASAAGALITTVVR